ncbi:hypothetical protein QUF70_18555, partial [Desulfobacterales bacterium HSG17]|nr:hypothetical protein [Desulfobacterales bacterium HSG17]
GTIPGEGVAALVLKRLDQAISDKDRIYAVIKGTGNASANGGTDAYKRSLTQALEDAKLSCPDISYIETHGSGDPFEDNIETQALHELFQGNTKIPAIGSVKPIIGSTGASAGLASVIKTGLCLFQEIIPPLINYTEPSNPEWNKELFHIPVFSQFWFRNRKNGPRRACAASITKDGNCSHIILEGFEYLKQESTPEKVVKEKKQPLGVHPVGLFVVEGNSKDILLQKLEDLIQHVEKYNHMGTAALNWYRSDNGINHKNKYAVSIIAENQEQIKTRIKDAVKAILSDTPKKMIGSGAVSYFPEPIGTAGEIAFVFPGSGNHYTGMGKNIGVRWPEILREMDKKNPCLQDHFLPEFYLPRRVSWSQGWEQDAHEKLTSLPVNMLSGQVSHSSMITRLIKSFAIKPDAVIGYSLGESTGLFATGAWSDTEEMLKRMQNTEIFSTELAGKFNAVRKAWKISESEDINWCTAVIKRPKDAVNKVVKQWPYVRLLIVNSSDECVIGGLKEPVEEVIKTLNCEAVFLQGVLPVHCDAAIPIAEEYKAMHSFPVNRPENIRYYSCATGKAYELNTENAADSILKQATRYFDFTTVIEQAYKDGVRIFIEMGPQASCKRMIDRILSGRQHSAVSTCIRGQDDYQTILKCLGTLIAERVPVDLENLYGNDLLEQANKNIIDKTQGRKKISVQIGGKPVISEQLPINNDQVNNDQVSSYQKQQQNNSKTTDSAKSEKDIGNMQTETSIYRQD